MVWWTLFWVTDFSLGPHRVEEARELFQAIFLRALIPFRRILPKGPTS